MKAHAEQTFKFDLTELTWDESQALSIALSTAADVNAEGDIFEVQYEYNSAVHKVIKELSIQVIEALRDKNWRE
jgi:hypothetical protein